MTTDVVTGFFVDQSIGLADRRSRVMNDFRHVSDLHSAFFDFFKSILITTQHLNFVPFGLRVKTDARQSPFANFAPLRETLARQYFRSHRLCIRDIRVIRGQPSHPGSLARPPFVPFCLRVKTDARQSPLTANN
jgi:hypothetical protein